MDLSKSINFLLENAGAVIKYRLRKEILKDLSKSDEDILLRQIYNLPYFKQVEGYAKPDGYIGNGAHTHSSWRGVSYHETRLQDGETAARLLSCYGIPKDHPLVKNFVLAMQDEETLRHAFSYAPPTSKHFENRYDGHNNGNSLMSIIYVMQALLGYGDDYENLREYQKTCLKGFERILEINALEDITTYNPNLKRKYNYPYINSDEYFPDLYTLEMLSFTQSWRNEKNVKIVADAINRVNVIMKPENDMSIRMMGIYKAPAFAFIRPFKPFGKPSAGYPNPNRIITLMSMLGAGDSINVLAESISIVQETLKHDGIMKMSFATSADKRKFIQGSEYPTCYSEILLEQPNYTKKYALECDLTFWAVQLLYHYGAV